MRRKEVNIRDPYILQHEGLYYMYGTRSATCWGPADGFDCYISEDLEEWEGPLEIFRRPEGFFADREYWAPECLYDEGGFYLITTFGAENRKKGIYVLRSDSPTGPFKPYSDRLTPKEWSCIDGTVYFEEGRPILIFSHSFEDSPDGDMCMLPLSRDFKRAEGEPVKLFSAAEAPWARPVPFAREEFGMEGKVYFTDGPCVAKLEDGGLYMTWSSWGDCGYAVGVAVSESGCMQGPWRQLPDPLFPSNGGHGMMFRNLEERLTFVLHYPNDKYMERPVFAELELEKGCLKLKEEQSPRQ